MRAQPQPGGLCQLIQLAPRDWATLALATMAEASVWDGALGWLAELADAHQLDTLADLITTVVRDPELFGYQDGQPPSVTEEQGAHGEAHRRRNLLAALCCTQALREGRTDGGLLAQVPTLPVRTSLLRGRPLFDDERLLMRLVVTGLLREGRKRHIAAAKYVLTEVGGMPGEATNVHIHRLDDPRHPTEVELPGNAQRSSRPRDLDKWQSEVLGVIATTQIAVGNIEKPLAYHGGSKPGGGPANSACHRSLVPLMERAGIKSRDVTASSISFSAGDRIQREQGTEAAVNALGRMKSPRELRDARAARDLRRLGTQPTSHAEPVVRSFLDAPFEPYQPPE